MPGLDPGFDAMLKGALIALGTGALRSFADVSLTCPAVVALSTYAVHLCLSGEQGDKQGKSDELLPDALNKSMADGIARAQQQLKKLTRNAGDANNPPPPEEPVYKVGLPCRRRLTAEEKAVYNRDGFVVCRGWFSPREVEVLAAVIREDHQIDAQKISVPDTEGRDTKLTLWWYLGDDTYGQFGRQASLVNAVSELMGGSEPYHSHSKVLLKEPNSGGAWEWHQGEWADSQ